MTCEYLAHADNMLTSFSLIFTSSNVVGGWVAPIFQLGIFAVGGFLARRPVPCIRVGRVVCPGAKLLMFLL